MLHLIAMAHSAGVELTLMISCVLVRKPSGGRCTSIGQVFNVGADCHWRNSAADEAHARCRHARWFCLTVTGKTWQKILADVADYPEGQQIILPFDAPIKKDSHLVVLKGNLSPTAGKNYRQRRLVFWRGLHASLKVKLVRCVAF